MARGAGSRPEWFRYIPVALFVFGCAFAGILGWTGFNAERARVDEQFRRNALDHVRAVETGFVSHLDTVNSLAGLFAAEAEVSRQEFRVFARALMKRYPNIRALEWVPRVTEANRRELEARARQDIPGFRFHGGTPRLGGGSAASGVSFPIYYVEPLAGNEEALGFDPPMHPIREHAIREAIETGALAVSAPTELVQGGAGGPSLLVFSPVFRPDDADGQRQPIGLAEGVFDVAVVFEDALSMLEPSGQDLYLWDITGTRILLHEHISRRAGSGVRRWHEVDGTQTFEREVSMGGRRWLFEVLPHPGFYRYDTLRALGFSLSVVLACAVLSVAIGGLLRRENVVSRLVAERTAQLSYQATHDSLTGLMNRVEFDRVLRASLERVRRRGDVATLAYLDLDQFKVVNDTCGHEAGDALLRQVGDVIATALKREDVLARLGGDEFGVLLQDCPGEDARLVAARIIETVQSFRFPWRDRVFSIGASIGMVQIDEQTESATAALSQADAACYVAKERGRGRYHLVRRGDGASDQYRRQMEWLSVLRRATEDDAFELWMQPITPVRADVPPAMFEVLLRLPMPDGTMAMPGAFLPAAERFLMMPEVDWWVIGRVTDLLHKRQLEPEAALWSVNISAQTLNDEDFAHRVLGLLAQKGVAPDHLCFEITETALIGSIATAGRLVAALREAGCRFALDDFGSGMSSFGYLKNLPVDFVKIDGSYICGMVDDASDRMIVRSIHDIAHSMGMRTIAESVESREVLEAVRRVGIDLVQGFHVGRPIHSGGWRGSVGKIAKLIG